MQYIIRTLLCLSVALTSSVAPAKKIFIFDLGHVLIGASRAQIAFKVGIWNFAVCLLNRFDIKQSMFDFLASLRGPQVQANPAHYVLGDGNQLPQIWLQYMNGEISGADVIAESEKNIDSFSATSRQKETMMRLIEAIFDPAICAQCMYPIKKGCSILAKLAEQPDVECWILSNLGADLFQALTERADMHEAIFQHVPEERRIVSGFVGASKPQPAIYDHLKARIIEAHPEFADPFYMASHTLFIDDQEENIYGSMNAGIPAFHLTSNGSKKRFSGNYENFCDVLKRIHCLT